MGPSIVFTDAEKHRFSRRQAARVYVNTLSAASGGGAETTVGGKFQKGKREQTVARMPKEHQGAGGGDTGSEATGCSGCCETIAA